MAKTCVKQRRSGTKTRKSNKSLRPMALCGKVHLGEQKHMQKKALETTDVENTSSTCQNNAPKYYEDVDVDEEIDTHFLQVPYRNGTTEDDGVELRKMPNFASYQFQQWMLETSNSCITLAERLEKLKGEAQIQEQELEASRCRVACDENWGRKPYDWILFSE